MYKNSQSTNTLIHWNNEKSDSPLHKQYLNQFQLSFHQTSHPLHQKIPQDTRESLLSANSHHVQQSQKFESNSEHFDLFPSCSSERFLKFIGRSDETLFFKWKNCEAEKKTVFRRRNDVSHFRRVEIRGFDTVLCSFAYAKYNACIVATRADIANLNFFFSRLLGPRHDLSTQNAGNAESSERELHSRLLPTSVETFSCLPHRDGLDKV